MPTTEHQMPAATEPVWVLGSPDGTFNNAEYVANIRDINSDYYLTRNDKKYWQLCHKHSKHQPISIDFSQPYYRFRGGKEWLPKALKGLQGASVADITAGWGRDSWLLAYRGFHLTLYERNPYLQILLQQGLEHANAQADIAAVAARLQLVKGDAIKALTHHYDIIYLDPMYPPKRKNAKVKKDMQALQQLLRHETNDTDTLFDVALTYSRKRTIVKRPQGAAYLKQHKPDYSINAPNTRFDVYCKQ